MKNNRSFFATLAAVAWPFFGLRRKKDFDADVEGSLNPLHLIVAILIGLVLFIGLRFSWSRWRSPDKDKR